MPEVPINNNWEHLHIEWELPEVELKIDSTKVTCGDHTIFVRNRVGDAYEAGRPGFTLEDIAPGPYPEVLEAAVAYVRKQESIRLAHKALRAQLGAS